MDVFYHPAFHALQFSLLLLWLDRMFFEGFASDKFLIMWTSLAVLSILALQWLPPHHSFTFLATCSLLGFCSSFADRRKTHSPLPFLFLAMGYLGLLALYHKTGELPLFFSWVSALFTIFTASVLGEYGEEWPLGCSRRAIWVSGVGGAVAGMILSWSTVSSSLVASLLLASFVLLGYLAKVNREQVAG